MTTATAPSIDAPEDRWISVFRFVAIAEAISWGALLLAMVFKYGPVGTDVGVRVVGPIHGTIFLVYLVATIVVGMRCAWSPKVILLGLFAAVPPFFTVVFEKWVIRSGLLRESTDTPSA